MELLPVIFGLLIAFQLKHFVADYLMQGPFPFILLGKGRLTKWFWPLLLHAYIHATITLTISFIVLDSIVMAATVFLFDLVSHFIIDRIKASPNMLGRFKPDNMLFWFSLGFDQMLHHLTHYAIIYIIITNL